MEGKLVAAYRFYGKIEHTEDTITSLYRAQYHAFSKIQMLVWMGVGFVMIMVAAFATIPLWAKTILLLIGALVITGVDFPAMVRADAVVEARRGNLPKMEYEFHKDAVKISGEGSMSISYKKVVRLAEEKNFLYLFMGRDSICMIDKESIRPNDLEAFKDFVAQKTDMTWQSEKSLLAFNLADVILAVRNKKEQDKKLKKK